MLAYKELYYVVFYDDRHNRHTTSNILSEARATELMNNLVQKQGYRDAQVVKMVIPYEQNK